MKIKTDNRPQITVVGGAHTEIFLNTAAAVNFQGSVVSDTTEVAPGGRAACVAAALARLRCRVFFVSCVGTDPFSGLLLTDLQRQNVNLDFVERTKLRPTGMVHHIVSRKGSVQRIYSPGSSMLLSRDTVNKASVMFSVSDIIIVTPDVPRDTFDFTVQLAHHFKAPVLVEPEPHDELPADDLGGFDVIVPDGAAAAALCGWEIKTMGDATRSVARLLARGAGAAALYLGERGVVSATDPRVPSFIPMPRGSMAAHPHAKSAFVAGVAWGLTLGYTLPEAAWIGTSCAWAMRTDVKEPLECFPRLDDLIEALSLDVAG